MRDACCTSAQLAVAQDRSPVLMYLQKLSHMYCLQVARHACTLARLSIGASPAPVKLLHTLLQVTLLALSHACQLPCSR